MFTVFFKICLTFILGDNLKPRGERGWIEPAVDYMSITKASTESCWGLAQWML